MKDASKWTDEDIIENFIAKAKTPIMERSLRSGRALLEQGKITQEAFDKLQNILISSIDGKGVQE